MISFHRRAHALSELVELTGKLPVSFEALLALDRLAHVIAVRSQDGVVGERSPDPELLEHAGQRLFRGPKAGLPLSGIGDLLEQLRQAALEQQATVIAAEEVMLPAVPLDDFLLAQVDPAFLQDFE